MQNPGYDPWHVLHPQTFVPKPPMPTPAQRQRAKAVRPTNRSVVQRGRGPASVRRISNEWWALAVECPTKLCIIYV